MCCYFYPRPPGGGRHKNLIRTKLEQIISIHALRVEGDHVVGQHDTCRVYFYPRPPGGGRRALMFGKVDAFYFYPRPPGGGRPATLTRDIIITLFLSTPSGWRATAANAAFGLFLAISIHALRVEGDHEAEFGVQLVEISIHALRVEGDLPCA